MKTIDLLLVDDEPDFREATRAALTRRGFVVSEAASGEDAIPLIHACEPDVVILDLCMPGMGGIETLAEMRKLNDDLPVVILTGQGHVGDALAGIGLGIVDFIQKPVDIDDLAARIRALLARPAGRRLRERSIGELLVPVDAYLRAYGDQPARHVVEALRCSLLGAGASGEITEQGHRTVLVFERDGRFVGCIRIGDVLDLIVPEALKRSSSSSYPSGMFLAQCKLVGNCLARDLIRDRTTIGAWAPLMEAVHLMVAGRLINLPVTLDGELFGMLRDKDLLLEMVQNAVWEEEK